MSQIVATSGFPRVFESYNEKIRSENVSPTLITKNTSDSRPSLIVDEKGFLENYSLHAQKLCLQDILVEYMANSSVHLRKTLLATKSRQIEMLMKLYDKQLEWLSCGSRLWFGQLTKCNVTVFIDLSNNGCGKNSYIDFIQALKLLSFEQLSLCDLVNINIFGSRVVNVNSVQNLAAAKPLGTCNMLSCLQYVVENINLYEKDHTLLFIICSKPDQSAQVLHDLMIQIFSGSELHLHFVSIDSDADIQILLKEISSQFNGHYHEYNSKRSDCMWDSVVQDIVLEKQRAQTCLLKIESIMCGNTDESLVNCIRQLSLVMDLPLSCSPPHLSLHSIPYSSKDWLKKYGLEACGLNLYDLIATDTFDQLSKYIEVIDKTALSSVYEVMPKLLWRDGTKKYLHVDVTKLLEYETDLKIHEYLLQLRLAWLQTGSRTVFGNLAEDRVVIILDCSVKSSLHSDYLKYHMKMLLQEQLSKKLSFDLIRYSGKKINEWKGSMCDSNNDHLADAWRWTREISPHGNNDLFNCLSFTVNKYVISEHSSVSSFGIYVVLSSIPDQDTDCINLYLEHILCSFNVQLHIILYQPNISDAKVETFCGGIGKYAENLYMRDYATSLSSSKIYATLHEFINEKFVGSSDYSLLVEEISRSRIFREKSNNILTDYQAHCKN